MFRLILIIAILYLGLKVYKAWKLFHIGDSRPVDGRESPRIDDVMVKDPYCQVYFPKRDGFRVMKNGEELYFCSRECRDNYMEMHHKSS